MKRASALLIGFLLSLLASSQQEHSSIFSRQKDKIVYANNLQKDLNNEQRISNVKNTKIQQGNTPVSLKRAKDLYREGRYGAAAKMFSESLAWAQQSSNREVEAQAMEGLGLCYSAFQKLPQSISALKQALLINKEVNNTKGLVRITKTLSDVCYSNQNFDSALYYADLSLQAATSLKMNEEIQLARLSLIAALIRLKKWKEVDKQISVFTQTPQNNQNISLWVQFHSLLGNYYLAKGQQELSEHHYTWAIQQAKASNASELLAVVYGHMIDSYYDRGDYNKALSSLQQYKISRNNSQSDANTATTLNNDLYKNEIYNLSIEKKFKELQLLQETEKSKLKDVQLWQGEVMRSNLERKNRSKDSLLLLKDLLLQMEKWLSEAQARETKKEMALQQVKNEQSLKQKELRLKEAEQLTINLLVGLGTALLLGSSIFYQYRRQRIKNIIIEQQKLELQTLMKEIHHRVKNNLQVISSLLDLQAQSITDSRASEAVKEGRNRVLSMALIHQNLYGDRSIQQIKVKDYILSLSQSLIHSYNIQPGSISIHTEIDELELDVDTVIPLGLILNELISNALKHAFKNRQSGEIHIVLKEKDSALHLRVKDNGAGFPAGAEFSPSPSFGWKLIKAFAAKLKAKLEMYNEEGACVALHIHKYKGAV